MCVTKLQFIVIYTHYMCITCSDRGGEALHRNDDGPAEDTQKDWRTCHHHAPGPRAGQGRPAIRVASLSTSAHSTHKIQHRSDLQDGGDFRETGRHRVHRVEYVFFSFN